MLASFTRNTLFGGISIAAAGFAPASAASFEAETEKPHLPPGRIVFQGDSITDGGRNDSDPNHYYGQDYAYIIAANCGGHYPAAGWYFYNRGISGNTVADLAARWQRDTLAIKPDLLSILIGVNDAHHAVMKIEPILTSAQFEGVYDQLLQQVVGGSPHIRLVLCEPFVLPVGHVKENWAAYQAEIVPRQDAVARLAAKYHAPVVHYQKMFTDACKQAPPDYWCWDGIHPTYSGHQLMADAWFRVVNRSF